MRAPGPMIEPAAQAIFDSLFDFEQRGRARFRTMPTGSTMDRLYGGQVVAQALDAARRTVSDERICHSLHAYFVRPGAPRQPIDLAVSCDADSRSFSARRVTARQGRALIFSLAASFQTRSEGPRFQAQMPCVPSPDALPRQCDIVAAAGERLPAWAHAFWRREQVIDYRFCQPYGIFGDAPRPPAWQVWMRLPRRLPEGQHLHQRLLAYASDLHIMHSGLRPLGIGWADEGLRTASLDHAIWFHDEFRVDEWLLYDLDSDFVGSARTLGRGRVFAQDGRLVATVMQEGLARLPR